MALEMSLKVCLDLSSLRSSFQILQGKVLMQAGLVGASFYTGLYEIAKAFSFTISSSAPQSLGRQREQVLSPFYMDKEIESQEFSGLLE